MNDWTTTDTRPLRTEEDKMGLNRHDARVATKELVSRLRDNPQGLRTIQLIGTPRFPGMRTLSARQVARLLLIGVSIFDVPEACRIGSGHSR